MQIDFTATLVSLDGKSLQSESGDTLLLGDVVTNALINQYSDENPSGVEKVKRWSIAKRVFGRADISLTADDIALIKNLVAKAYGPIVVGQVWSIIDPESVK